MDWEEQQRKIVKLKKAKDILSTNEKVARLVLTGEIDRQTAKIISTYINNAIKCIELLQYEEQLAELEQTINDLLNGGGEYE